MATTLPQQTVDNLVLDAEAFGKFMIGSLSETVVTRTAAQYPTLARLIQDIAAAGGYQPFDTTSELTAATPDVEKQLAKALDTGKVWAWQRTSLAGAQPVTGVWRDTGLSELDQAKEFAESNAMFKPVRVDADTPQDLFLEQGIYIVPQSIIADALMLPESARGEIISTGKTRSSNYSVHKAFYTENGSVYHSFYSSNNNEWTEWSGFDARSALHLSDVTYKAVSNVNTPNLNILEEDCQLFIQRSTYATPEKGYPFQAAGYFTQQTNLEGAIYQNYLSKDGYAMRWGIPNWGTPNSIDWREWSGFKSAKSIIDLDSNLLNEQVSDTAASSYVNYWSNDYFLSNVPIGATSRMNVTLDSLNNKPVYKLTLTQAEGNKYAVWYLDDFPREAFYASFLIYATKPENVQYAELTRLRLRRSSDNNSIEIYPTITDVGDGYFLLRYVVDKVDADRDILVVSFDVSSPEIGDSIYVVDGYIGTSKISKFEDRKYLLHQPTPPDVKSDLEDAIAAGRLTLNKNGQLKDSQSVFDFASFWGSSTIMLMQPFLTTAMQANGIPNTIERGKGAEWVEHTSTRFGSYEMIANPRTTGDVIPESGSVAITSNLPTYTLEHMLPFDAEIAGIAGRISFDSSIRAQIFTRSESGEATAFKDAVVTPVYDQTYRNGVIIINVGKNNFTMGAASGNAHLATPEHVFNETVKMYEHCRSVFKKVLILDNFVNGSTPAESTVRDSIVKCNQLLKDKFCDLLVSSYDYLVGDIFPDTNTIPTTADLEQIALKNLPPSMRIDNGHLNDKANQAIVDHLILPRMRKFGWID